MSKKRSPFIEMLKDAWFRLAEGFKNSTLTLSMILFVMTPPICLAVGVYATHDRGGAVEIGGEWFVPLVLILITAMLRGYANKVGKGVDCPVPEERFTEELGDGEVVVSTERLQEMILYVDDVENYLERRGML